MLPLTHITVHSPYGWPSEYCCAVTTEWEVGWFPFFKKWGGAWAGVLIWRTTNFWQTNFEPPRAVFSLILRQLYLIPRNHSLSCAICHSHSDLILGFWIDQHKKIKGFSEELWQIPHIYPGNVFAALAVSTLEIGQFSRYATCLNREWNSKIFWLDILLSRHGFSFWCKMVPYVAGAFLTVVVQSVVNHLCPWAVMPLAMSSYKSVSIGILRCILNLDISQQSQEVKSLISPPMHTMSTSHVEILKCSCQRNNVMWLGA